MNKKQRFREILIFAELVIAFSLGVFGNKLAEIVKINPYLIILGTIALIILMFLATVLRISDENNDNDHFLSRYTLLIGKISTIFPVSLITGIVVALVCIAFVSGERFYFYLGIGIWSYEVIAFILSSCLIYLMIYRNRDKILILSFSAGLSTGLSSAILVLRSQENHPLFTFTGWFTTLFLSSVVLNSSMFNKFIENFRKAIEKSENNNSSD
jgi:hypothetical protein